MGRCQQKVVGLNEALETLSAIPTSLCSYRLTIVIASSTVGTASCGEVSIGSLIIV
jgi:hypothetical protein